VVAWDELELEPEVMPVELEFDPVEPLLELEPGEPFEPLDPVVAAAVWLATPTTALTPNAAVTAPATRAPLSRRARRVLRLRSLVMVLRCGPVLW
jgi:hypothetical protein